MMTALYVFIGIMASYIGIYIFEVIIGFIKKVNKRDEDEPRANPSYANYNARYGTYTPYNYGSDNSWRLRAIKDKLDSIEDKIDTLIEDAAELMVAKERPEE